MTERDYNLPAFDPLVLKALGKTRWPTVRFAPTNGAPIQPLEVLWRLSKGQSALPEAHDNDPIGLDLDTGDPGTKPGEPPKGHVITNDTGWFTLEVYDQALAAGGPLFEVERVRHGFGSKLGVLFSARVKLRMFRHEVKQRDGSVVKIAKWRMIRFQDVRPDPRKDDIVAWFPLHLWLSEEFRLEKSEEHRTFVDSLKNKTRTFNRRNITLRGNVFGRPHPIFAFGYDRASFDALKVSALSPDPDRKLAIHLYSDQKSLGGTINTTRGERVASLKGHFGPSMARGQRPRPLQVNLSKLIEEDIKRSKGEPTTPDVSVLSPTYKYIPGVPYMVVISPAMTRVRQNAPLRVVAVHTGISFAPVEKGRLDTVRFVLLNSDGALVEKLVTQQGILDSEFKEKGQVSANVIANSNHFYRWADLTLKKPGEFRIGCFVQMGGKGGFKGALIDVEVGKTEKVLNRAIQDGLADGLSDPWQALGSVREYLDRVDKVTTPTERKRIAAGKLVDEKITGYKTYESALLALLRDTKLQGTSPFLPGEYQRMPIVRCEVRHAAVQGTQPITELRLCMVISGSEDGAEVLCRIIDWTNPMEPGMHRVSRGTHPTSALIAMENAMTAWVLECGHPDGRIAIYVDEPYRITRYRTKEKSTIQEVSEWLEYAALGFAAIAGIASLIATAPVSAPATVALVATWLGAATGTAAVTLRVYDRHRHGVLGFGRRDVMDGLDLVGSMFSFGSLRWAKGATVITRLSPNAKAANFVFFGQVGTDAVSGLLIAEEHVHMLLQAVNAKHLKPSERLDRTLSVLRGMTLTGVMAVMNFRASKADIDGLEIPGVDHAAFRRQMKTLEDPSLTIDAIDPRTKVRGDTSQGKKRVEVDPAPRRKGQIDVPEAKPRPKRPPGHTYEGPKRFQAVFEGKDPVKASCSADCQPVSVKLGERLFGKLKKRGDVTLAQGHPTHYFLTVGGEGPEDILVDATLYQYFRKKDGGALEDADLEAFGLQAFEGTREELRFYLDELASHPQLQVKSELFDGPDDMFDKIWGRKDLVVFPKGRGETLGTRLLRSLADGTPRTKAEYGMRRLLPVGTPDPPLGKTVNADKMKRHVLSTQKPGTDDVKKSYFESVDEANTVLAAIHSGEAKLIGRSPARKHSVYEFTGQTGTFRFEELSLSGETVIRELPTHLFFTKGGVKAKTGASTTSVVPADPRTFAHDAP